MGTGKDYGDTVKGMFVHLNGSSMVWEGISQPPVENSSRRWGGVGWLGEASVNSDSGSRSALTGNVAQASLILRASSLDP